MYDIRFYKDKDGNEPVKEYIKQLAEKNDKDSRINLNKLRDYIKMLSLYGTAAGEPYVKHLDGKIWGFAQGATVCCFSPLTVTSLSCYLTL